MGWEAVVTLVVVGLMFVVLARNWAPPDLTLLGSLTLLVVAGFVTGTDRLPNPRDAVSGFGNSGLVTVAVLYVVVEGLVRTGALTWITQWLLGRPASPLAAQARLMGPVFAMSAFLNNTPVVAMFLPVVNDWCKKTRISPSKLFIPLSYASIFGGMCTLIGTSTNLVVNGLVMEQAHLPSLGMFHLVWIGVPCGLVGIGYVLLASRWLLPDRKPAISITDDPRQYTVEMLVDPRGPLVNKTIEQAGLRHLPGLYVTEIDRAGQIIAPVGPDVQLAGGDRLVFVGIVESVVDLQKMRGLMPATDQVFKLDAPQTQRCLIEAVVSNQCPLIGRSIRKGRFRNTYNAAVIAVARSGERIRKKIGDIVLRPGDTLLLHASHSFPEQQRNARDFFLVSAVENSAPSRHERAWVALAILVGMVTAATVNLLDMLTAAMLAACLMILTRCCTGTEARRSIQWQVLVVIGAALGLGAAMESSGLAGVVAHNLVDLAGGHPWLVLLAVYAVTSLFTEMITNNAAAVLVFPIAFRAAEELGVDFMPFIICIMIGASASFATPIGYQTNLMVYGPGGYRFADFVRFGLPLNLIVMAVAVLLAPMIWPFS